MEMVLETRAALLLPNRHFCTLILVLVSWVILSPDLLFFGSARSCTFRVEIFYAAIAWLGLGTRRAPLQANIHFWPHAWILGYFESSTSKSVGDLQALFISLMADSHLLTILARQFESGVATSWL